MFIELTSPKVIDVYRTGNLGSAENSRSKVRIDETGKVTPITLNLTFRDDAEVGRFIEALTAALTKRIPQGI